MSKGLRTFKLYLNDYDATVITVKVPTKIIGFEDEFNEDMVVAYAYDEGYITEEDYDYIDYVEEEQRVGHFDIVNSYL